MSDVSLCFTAYLLLEIEIFMEFEVFEYELQAIFLANFERFCVVIFEYMVLNILKAG